MKKAISGTNPMTKVFFFLPSRELVDRVPATIDNYWAWINESVRIWPARLGQRDIPCTWLGPYNWVIQTFLYLRADNFPCQLLASLPDEGIVITHGDFLPKFLKPLPRRFIVEIKPDRSLQCKHANYFIVQNRHDPICRGIRSLFLESSFMNYWPQPGLIPRDQERGDRFENVCFMGNPEQFITEIDALSHGMKKLGLQWKMVPRERWNDYREVDAIVAVRPVIQTRSSFIKQLFSRWKTVNYPALSPERKPASKLLNAWTAGTPAIVSPDPAFEDLRTSDLDYLGAHDVPEIIERLKQLRDSPELRRAMSEHGMKRADEYKPEKIVAEWKSLITNQILPKYGTWTQSTASRSLFILTRDFAHTIRFI